MPNERWHPAPECVTRELRTAGAAQQGIHREPASAARLEESQDDDDEDDPGDRPGDRLASTRPASRDDRRAGHDTDAITP